MPNSLLKKPTSLVSITFVGISFYCIVNCNLKKLVFVTDILITTPNRLVFLLKQEPAVLSLKR